MTEESEGQSVPPSGTQSGHTPRKVNPDGGGTKQTALRDDIARHMRGEMLECSVESFLEQLAPFSPGAQWIDNAYEHLKKERLLGTPAETALPVAASQGRSTSNSARAEAEAGAGTASHNVNTENADTVQWRAYRNAKPAQMGGTEMKTFKPLEKIVNALRGCPDPDEERGLNGYHYKDCPSQEMKSEILGANFKVDAVVANPNIYEINPKAIPLAAAQAAVVMEFKKVDTAEKVLENRKQLVAAANHIMNDDPRRNWMYGITIENTDMSLWYFSRSYSMKSTPFDFTTDFKTFIRVFLSFLYAKDDELGHDPSIFRQYLDKKWCYVYELKEETSSKYYKTIEPLYNSRSHCITGRKSRVWKVIEVTSSDGLTTKLDARETVLKDCWVNKGSLSEREIQEDIFKRLKDVKEADYAWAPVSLKRKIKAGLARPERYFMKVVLDWKAGFNKEKPDCQPGTDLLSDSAESTAADEEKVIASTQTPSSTAHPSPHASNTTAPAPPISQPPSKSREYRVKQHYRVVYADVGESLAHATSLSDAVQAFEDIFVALTLLFLASWVHRDVSEGNIILVRGQDGVKAKLSDLEYARFFDQEDGAIGTDPKTGTPYFMPIEIHKGEFIFDKPESDDSDTDITALMTTKRKPGPRQHKTYSPSLRHNFAHDLESLWWIIVWIILVRIEGAKLIHSLIFTVLDTPHRKREAFFKKRGVLRNHPEDFIPDALCDCNAHFFLTIYSKSLQKFYASGDRQDPTRYRTIFKTVWTAMELFIDNISGVSMKLENPSKRPPPIPVSWIGPQARGKRSRSPNNDEVSGREMTVEAGSSRKKQKSDGDVFADTDVEDTAQDMAGIVREDSNPRIRTIWE